MADDARARRPSTDLDGAPELVDARTPLQALLRAEGLREVQSRLEALPTQTQELLSLRYGDELSHRQIAELLGLSEDAVKQRVSRAIRELRKGAEA